ncbi:uncharacterized protein JCM6883_003365 [Sporobolomyces salmoneus]|uniref:uncharacterized protein n=1 Tax=Sporobolomyces salmoneus TaxID=183962 RepID=UPI00317DDA1E
MAHRPSSIPVPSHQPSVPDTSIPPTPSAFPSLSGDSSSTPSLPASTLHYAEVTGKVLPPTSIPKGISLPPPVHPPTTSINSNNQNSRERHQSSGQKNRDSPYARPGPGQRTTSGGSRQGDKKKSAKPATNGSSTSQEKGEAQENKRKTIPGMPPAWVAKNSKTAPAPKGTHARRKSEGSPSFVLVKEKEQQKNNDDANHLGKKKRQNLQKQLDPAHSKLSALAPSFEFVPRSATSPNLSAQAQDSSAVDTASEGNDSSREEEETSPRNPSSLGSYLSSSFSLTTPSSLTSLDSTSSDDNEQSKKDPAEGLVDEKLAASIVSSSGPQADGFVGQSFTQSESGARPDADKTGFNPIAGVVNESPLADLEWKEKMGWWREDYDPKVPRTEEELEPVKEEEEEVKLAPAAVEANSHEKPLLQFPPWTPSSSSTSSEEQDIDLSDSKVSPALLSEVLPHSFSDPPSPASASDEKSPTSPDDESRDDSISAPVASTSESKSAAPSPSSFLPTSFTPPLSGYGSTSTSFDSSFLSQDELRAEKLAQEGPAEPITEQKESTVPDMPLSAEAVASQPTLDDALDVEEVPTGEKKEEEVRKGWWNSDEKENETEKPQPGQAERSADLVDPKLAEETVRSAGAQADGFSEKGFTEVDRVGAEASEGEKEVKKEVEKETKNEESHQEVIDDKKKEEEQEEEEVNQGRSTPLGSFLSSAFQPADISFASSSSSKEVEATPASDEKEPSSSSSSSTPVPSSSQPTQSSPLARDRSSSSPPPPPERRPSESHAADSAPSLTLAISSAWHTAPWSRKLWAIIASVAINIGLPFVNGVMLGFGELFARNVLGVRFGWPLHNDTATTGSSSRANTGGVGLRSAGAYKTSNVNGGRGVGTDVPGHAGAKTALEGVVESIAE